MHRAVAFALLIFVCLLSRGAPAFAGTPERAATSNAGEEGETASAESPKPISNVEVKNGRLSVELVDAGFGEVMQKISEKSGIKVEITGGVYAKTVTASFSGLDLERDRKACLL